MTSFCLFFHANFIQPTHGKGNQEYTNVLLIKQSCLCYLVKQTNKQTNTWLSFRHGNILASRCVTEQLKENLGLSLILYSGVTQGFRQKDMEDSSPAVKEHSGRLWLPTCSCYREVMTLNQSWGCLHCTVGTRCPVPVCSEECHQPLSNTASYIRNSSICILEVVTFVTYNEALHKKTCVGVSELKLFRKDRLLSLCSLVWLLPHAVE